MAFHVEIQPQAFDDLDSIAEYIKARSSFSTAEKWFNGIMGEIATLEQMPERCPIAPEPDELPTQRERDAGRADGGEKEDLPARRVLAVDGEVQPGPQRR